MTHLPRTLVIVGAGFSGTTVAINLLRLSYWRPLRIVLLERAYRMGRGVAYADKDYPYPLNVPAGVTTFPPFTMVSNFTAGRTVFVCFGVCFGVCRAAFFVAINVRPIRAPDRARQE